MAAVIVGHINYQVNVRRHVEGRRASVATESASRLILECVDPKTIEVEYDKEARDFFNKPVVNSIILGNVTIKRDSIIRLGGRQPYRVYAIDARDLIDAKENKRETCKIGIRSREDNVASYLIAPMFFDQQAEGRFHTNYVGCFVGTDDTFEPLDISVSEDLLERRVVLVYRFSKEREFEIFESILMEMPEFEFSMDLDDYQVGYVMSIPPEYKQDFELILNSKYSHLSENFKDHLLQFYGAVANKSSTLYQILYRSPERRRFLEEEYDLPIGSIDPDTELYKAFTPSKEILKRIYLLDDLVLKSKENKSIV